MSVDKKIQTKKGKGETRTAKTSPNSNVEIDKDGRIVVYDDSWCLDYLEKLADRLKEEKGDTTLYQGIELVKYSSTGFSVLVWDEEQTRYRFIHGRDLRTAFENVEEFARCLKS